MQEVQRAILNRLQPAIIEQKLQNRYAREVEIGCETDISPVPVSLEYGITLDEASRKVCRFEVLFDGLNAKLHWEKNEYLIRQLAGLAHCVGFEIVGNSQSITCTFLCSEKDIPKLKASLLGSFPQCALIQEIGDLPELLEQGEPFHCIDYYPTQSYEHTFTDYEELGQSPILNIFEILAQLPANVHGFSQCLFTPCQLDWHRRVEQLRDVRFALRMQRASQLGLRGGVQQVPSGDFRQNVHETCIKAHNDRPFFAVALRVGVIGKEANSKQLDALQTPQRVFQYGGSQLRYLTKTAYDARLSQSVIKDMLVLGHAHRRGFLLNSKELTGLVHLASVEKVSSLPLKYTHSFAPQTSTDDGVRVGFCDAKGTTQEVRIADMLRRRSVHALGQSGCGKTSVLLHMALQDIEQGTGLIFIDPHGDAVNDLCQRISQKHHERCIVLDPGDQENIPLWNPLLRTGDECRFQKADDMLSAFKRVFRDWGDRLGHVLRNALIGLSYLESPCLLDLYHLLRQKSVEGEKVRKAILANCDLDEPIRTFWERDFLKDYRENELAASKHKLSQLLSGSVYLMLSQSKSEINLREIMDGNKVLLVDLSKVGSETRQVLGSFLLTLVFLIGLERSKQRSQKREPFSVFADECHQFIAVDAIEQMISEARKFNIRLCIAHQYLGQFHSRKVEALSTTGVTIAGRVNSDDAHFLSKNMSKQVNPQDLQSLNPYEFIAKIDTDVVKFRSEPLSEGCEKLGEQLRSQSHAKYCRKNSLQKVNSHTVKQNLFDLTSYAFTEKDFNYAGF